MNEEPVAITGGIMSVIVAAFGVAVIFGLPLTADQVGACITLAGAIIALITVIQRSKVSPVGKYADK